MVQFTSVLSKFYDEYQNNTPKKLKMVDAYLAYILLTGITQFIYCCFVGTFPFNAFLSGFISTVSCFILAGELITSDLFQFLHVIFFQFVYDSNRIHKTRANSSAFHLKEDMQTLSLLILFYTWLWSTLSANL